MINRSLVSIYSILFGVLGVIVMMVIGIVYQNYRAYNIKKKLFLYQNSKEQYYGYWKVNDTLLSEVLIIENINDTSNLKYYMNQIEENKFNISHIYSTFSSIDINAPIYIEENFGEYVKLLYINSSCGYSQTGYIHKKYLNTEPIEIEKYTYILDYNHVSDKIEPSYQKEIYNKRRFYLPDCSFVFI